MKYFNYFLHEVTLLSRVLISQQLLSWSRNFPSLIEPEGSFLHSDPATHPVFSI